ncbi:MAG: hypothetical protein HC853_02320 [Anaerolineae bacterium]|nr:hypothetical protein [Anaerolineae bacterium]
MPKNRLNKSSPGFIRRKIGHVRISAHDKKAYWLGFATWTAIGLILISCASSTSSATPNASDLRATARAIDKQKRDLADAQQEVLDQAKRQEDSAKTVTAATAYAEQTATAQIRATDFAKAQATAEMQATATAIERVTRDAQATAEMLVTQEVAAQATITAEHLRAVAQQTAVAEQTQAPLRITGTAIALEGQRQRQQLQSDLARVFSFLPLVFAVLVFVGWGIITLSKAIRAKKKTVERVIVANVVAPASSTHEANPAKQANKPLVISGEDTQWEMSIEEQE